MPALVDGDFRFPTVYAFILPRYSPFSPASVTSRRSSALPAGWATRRLPCASTRRSRPRTSRSRPCLSAHFLGGSVSFICDVSPPQQDLRSAFPGGGNGPPPSGLTFEKWTSCWPPDERKQLEKFMRKDNVITFHAYQEMAGGLENCIPVELLRSRGLLTKKGRMSYDSSLFTFQERLFVAPPRTGSN